MYECTIYNFSVGWQVLAEKRIYSNEYYVMPEFTQHIYLKMHVVDCTFSIIRMVI